MARIRTIKPGFFTSEDVSALPIRARLTWIGLWTHCDDAGRAKDNVKLIKAAVWPLDTVTLRDIEEDLATLAAHGRIVRYEVDGARYLAVTNWSDHQRVNKPTPSKIPPPPTMDGGPPPRHPGGSVDNPTMGYPQGADFSTDESVIDAQTDNRSPPGALPESSGSPPAGNKEGNREGKGISPHARTREAARWLHTRYGLTDLEAAQVIEEVQARAPDPIEHLIPYLDGMAEGDLADIVKAVMDAGQSEPDESADPRPPWCGTCDERTRLIDPDRPRRCPACHPLREGSA